VLRAGLAYAAGVVGYALLRPLLGDREGWLELADDLEPWAYLPGPAIGILGGALGSGGVAATGAAMMATFGLRWGHRYLRPSQANREAEADLRFMTYNTLAWQREGRDLAASIVKAAPDVVGLQEIGPRAAEYLASTLAARYPYSYVTRAASSSGAATLSRFPLVDPVAFRASSHGHWWQRMIVETSAGPITFINLHTKIPHIQSTHHRGRLPGFPLDFRAQRRHAEIQMLMGVIEKIEGPLVVSGDFNMTERSSDYRLLATRLKDAYKAVGVGLGHSFPRRGSFPIAFPAPWPTLRLDYVWHSNHFAPTWAYRGDAGKSDHHPIVVGLCWAEQAGEVGQGIPLAASAV
jgi:endonuclease/exonuclease/phosphatase (EEP) superfamily protein YafD